MKVVLFAFRGEVPCLLHAFLNALDISSSGGEARVVLEGEATGLIPKLFEEGSPLKDLFQKVARGGMLAGVCRACSHMAGTLKTAEEMGLAVLDEMSGHPSMGRWMREGWTVVTL